MLIFMKRLIPLFMLFSPVQLTHYKLIQADFNTGHIVYEDDVCLFIVAHNTYKITSSDGEQSFRVCDIITMIGTYVEFDTCDLKLKVRCIFENLITARSLARKVKTNINSQIEFPLYVVAPVLRKNDTYDCNDTTIEAICGAALYVEFGNRFIVTSDCDGSIAMIFTGAHFNVSPIFKDARMFMVIQKYDIRKKDIVKLKFYLTFPDDEIANRFYKYVKHDLRLVTNNMISVVIPSQYHYIRNALVRENSQTYS